MKRTIRTIKGLELLQKISQETNNSKEIEGVLREIVVGAIELTNATTGIIFLIDRKGENIIAKFHPDGDEHSEPRLNKPDGLTRTIINKKKMLIISDCKNDEKVNPIIRNKYKSIIAIPLNLHDRVVGVLFLNHKEEREFQKIEISFLETLASQSAVLIHMRNSEAQYSSMLNNLPQSIFMKDMNSKFIFANDSFCNSIEMPLEKLKGLDDFDIYPADFAISYVNEDKRVIKSRIPIEQEERHPTKVGEKWVKVTKLPIKDVNDEIVGVQAIFWDITEERIAKERYKDLVEQSPDGIVIHKNGLIILANSVSLDLFGVHEKADLLNKYIVDFIIDSDKKLAEYRLNEMHNDRPVLMAVMKIKKQNAKDEYADVEVYAKHSKSSDKEIQVVFHDITRINKLLGETEHRVRNSLQTVSNLLARQQRYIKSKKIKDVFKDTQTRIQAIANIHSILSRNETGKNINIREYFISLKNEIFKAYGVNSQDINVIFSVDNDINISFTKATLCGLILNELLSNSIKYAFKKNCGNVSISFSFDENGFIFLYSDNGCGLKDGKIEFGRTMGLDFVEFTVKRELRGELKIINKDGLSYEIIFSK